jgi:hypothetical protein
MTRCTYCLRLKEREQFLAQGDHVIPAVLGGSWVDASVCDQCNRRANRSADELIARDSLVRYLRDAYRIRNRRDALPPPCRFFIRVPQGGGVTVTLSDSGPSFQAGMPAVVMRRLGITSKNDQVALKRVVAEQLSLDNDADLESIRLAQAAQEFAARPTSPTAWSRFMAKVGLACGREAYGDTWLDGRQAQILSGDLLGRGAPQFAQRSHYPPVEVVWPFEPPKHRIWIEPHEDTAVLMIVLFGQLLGAVPVSDIPGPTAEPSAWSVDPLEGSVERSNYPAVKYGTAAARLTQEGHNVVTVLRGSEEPFFYIEDGPDGPADVPIPTMRAESPTEGFKLFQRVLREQEEAKFGSSTSTSSNEPGS